MTRKEQIKFLQELEAGCVAQITEKGIDRWRDCFNGYPVEPDFCTYDYRIKPKLREWWIVELKTNLGFTSHAFSSLESATGFSNKPIHVREVP